MRVPYRFKPGVDGASRTGRDVPGPVMEFGEWRKFALERSFAPAWADAASWHERYDRDPVRLWVRPDTTRDTSRGSSPTTSLWPTRG